MVPLPSYNYIHYNINMSHGIALAPLTAQSRISRHTAEDTVHVFPSFRPQSRRVSGDRRRLSLAIPHSVRAAEPLKVGILIPGSKSDKGWMESRLRWP